MFDPVPRTVLITGAARRIGRALALRLGQSGWRVAVHFNTSQDEAEDVARHIRAAGSEACVLDADLGREAEVQRLVERATAALGPVGCLINNASLFESDDALTATRESWDAHLETNLRAPFVLTQNLARALPASAQGVVINLLDERVWNLTPYFVSYTLSKSALWTLTRTMAMALAPRIRVNAIGPGPALPSPRQSQAQFDAQCAAMPLGRGTTPEEICRTAQFILDAPSLTGQMIALDGGQHLGWALGGTPPDE
jgi:NAD(P)-dependent dehydrogenase (short-subunit alcohol dehydrogenase family)